MYIPMNFWTTISDAIYMVSLSFSVWLIGTITMKFINGIYLARRAKNE